MSHVALFNNSGYGHVIPTLSVVHELVRRGHRVTYVTGDKQVDRVAAAAPGARVLGYDSQLVQVDLSEMVTAAATSRMPGIYLQESVDIMRVAEPVLEADRPDLIAFDMTVYAAGRILARKWDVPAAACYPAFASNEHFSFLDEMVARMPDKGSIGHPALRAFFARLTRVLAEHGQADRSIEQVMGQVEDLNLVYYPKSFQPAGSTFDDRFTFMGPCLDYVERTDEPWTPPGDGKPVVFISLGTSVHRQPEFFRMCVETFADMPWHTVLAVHTAIDPAELAPLPPNIEAHRWIPHLAVLAHADVFVSHAGLGSVMGALHKGVPLVLVPSSPEHKVVAQRVAELGLGRVVREQVLSPARLRAAVAEVAADGLTRNRVRRMRQDIVDAGGAASAVDAIERRIAARSLVG
ncbi:macrolide family glycosyltransferase [Labedaea rhizosphaerae]|uniref:dTDP-L-oleandrosyltransferase n=1 Tax=Labedaea rhizosphaerae TaxID=598644 RepID=A0A4R6S065_LABRH|nr:macrolide family glycosyltransferase [Labedaea rhizosphaerae]TDP92889.1 dTDP-L-oleandrosyltransferase [Labedaea rhizosphaerae]